ncbi:ATP-binding protein [Denitrobaculum tricleocarpae]|uniref:Sensory/regulatory protein RpfC n=1 Tax=Denitrobaculum tricleocarpae TaxID=2591009 RepID=A0A545TXY2_9PROT|nr:ATP-binding protein [Denitrobaculum tricleocarpae]TQV82041.1 response regulator [Denitrobaculum tricleocarpae]
MASSSVKAFGRKEDRNPLLALLLIAVAALSTTWLSSYDARVSLLKQQATGSGPKREMFPATGGEGLERLSASFRTPEKDAQIPGFAGRGSDVFLYKPFDRDGAITVASWPSDLGKVSAGGHFTEIVQRGESFEAIAEDEAIAKDQRLVSEASFEKSPKDVPARHNVSYFFWGIAGLLLFWGMGWTGVILRNLHERNIREQELMDTQAELGARLSELRDARERVEAEATAQVMLAEELSMARDEADAANKAKSQFLATMSHEIRTPMNGVLGMLGILSDTDLTDDQMKYTRLARDSAESLLSIIDDILDYSKLEEGRIDLEEVDYSPEQVIDGVVSLLSSKANDVGLSLSTEGTDELPTWLRGDPTRVRQILFNLIGNAVKFTERGGVRVIASHKMLPDNEIEVRVDVKDTGVGIAPESQEKLFKRFSQADSSTTRRFGGSGLGLVICRQLAQLMHGGVGLYSEVGKGSTFWFTIRCPLGEAPVQQLRSGFGMESSESQLKLKILVAEDNAVNQLVAKTILTKAGHDVAVVENGFEAVAAVRENAFDVVLMDIQMPEMDGPMATKEIRGLPAPLSEIKIVALTANAMAGHREEYLAAGMDDYVTKPIDPRQLFAALVRVTKDRQPKSPDVDPSEEAISDKKPPHAVAPKAADQGDVPAPVSGREIETEDPAEPAIVEREVAPVAARSSDNDTLSDTDTDTANEESESNVTSLLPLFDREKFDELRDALGDDGLQEALGFVPTEAAKSLAEIKNSIAAGDLETAQRAAHSIKGMASNFGAVRLQNVAREIETESPDIETVTQKLADLEDTLTQTQLEIDQLKSA